MRKYVQRVEGYRPRGQPSSSIFGAGIFLLTVAMIGAIPIAAKHMTDNPNIVLWLGVGGALLMSMSYTIAYASGGVKRRR